ncbi:MAG: prolipoprotein diacylglyceryl transferase [Clostridia bacterium]|nr:prolipoprotein diacylglyceryl transferase [Clostridia bacterium]
MIPEIITPYGTIPTFPCFVVLGVLSFILVLHVSLKKAANQSKEEDFIFLRLVVAGIVAWFFAGLFDASFKYFEYGTFEWKGITFYGGLFGAVLCLVVLLYRAREKQKTQFSVQQWFDLLALPLVSFHFFGRLGCFFAGCCYGKITNSGFGVVFLDQPEQGIIHGGVQRYPTQLFEAILLLVVFFVLIFVKKRAPIYLICYSLGRFLIEFYRGDDRGYLSELLSPAQMISVFVFAFAIWLLIKRIRNNESGNVLNT